MTYTELILNLSELPLEILNQNVKVVLKTDDGKLHLYQLEYLLRAAEKGKESVDLEQIKKLDSTDGNVPLTHGMILLSNSPTI